MYLMRHTCGCCFAELDITPEEADRIHRWIWEEGHLGSNIDVEYTDRHGRRQVAESVDTFYGIWHKSEHEEEKAPLMRLLKNLQALQEGE